MNLKHGMNRTPTHNAWNDMRKRCLNPNHPAYGRYGGRGITVCDRWANFSNFLEDMGERPPGLWLERKDNDKGYEPANCAWVTVKEQCRNRSSSKMLTFQGKTQAMAAWAEEKGMSPLTLRERLRRGWSVDDAISKPVGTNNWNK